MANLTSECDSNTFVGEEMQHHLSYYFPSLTTDMNRDCHNPQVIAAQERQEYALPLRGVRVHYFFYFWLSVNSLSSPENGYSEGR